MRSFDQMPLRAPNDVVIATTSGMARPSACGQAMTSTVATRMRTSSFKPSSHQPTAVTKSAAERDVEEPTGRTIGQDLRATTMLRRATRRMIPASAVSSPVAVTRTRRLPVPFTVPAMTRVAWLLSSPASIHR